MQVEDEVHPSELLLGEPPHALVEGVFRVEQAGEVVEDQLAVGGAVEAHHGQSGGLGLGADDGQVGADEAVEEGGLAGIGASGEGDVTGSGHGET